MKLSVTKKTDIPEVQYYKIPIPLKFAIKLD